MVVLKTTPVAWCVGNGRFPAGVPPQDPAAAHLGGLLQGPVGHPLQPQQVPHQELPGREQVGTGHNLKFISTIFRYERDPIATSKVVYLRPGGDGLDPNHRPTTVFTFF